MPARRGCASGGRRRSARAPARGGAPGPQTLGAPTLRSAAAAVSEGTTSPAAARRGTWAESGARRAGLCLPGARLEGGEALRRERDQALQPAAAAARLQRQLLRGALDAADAERLRVHTLVRHPGGRGWCGGGGARRLSSGTAGWAPPPWVRNAAQRAGSGGRRTRRWHWRAPRARTGRQSRARLMLGSP